MNEHNTYELVEKYCHGFMDDKEKMFFEIDMENNPALAQLVHEHKTLINTFDHHNNREFIRYSLDSIHKHSHSQTHLMLKHLKLSVNKYWRTASVAAVVAVTASVLTFLFARSIYKKDTQATYQLLKGEINNIKKDQRAIKHEVDKVKINAVPVPDYPSKFSGTGFAISKNGYLVTNLHVVDGYTKIFTFTEDGIGHQCNLVVKDELNDLAILKINEDDFKFSGNLPYSIKKSNINLAHRIYSLGYPKNEIVYNEGYISSVTGFDGDSNKFQLELPSNPGVSGAPIIDETGNVLGIISGKQSQTEGVTFAIKSKELINLVKELPEDFKTSVLQENNIRSLNRSGQINQIRKFVCMVKVYN
ncbi:MAG: trypsin-like peptidase domain-containing protein [Bacteroidetes bacterium]|nr:trypsin-like peptidase domain-containing protein [Bacteroidota bacterium]